MQQTITPKKGAPSRNKQPSSQQKMEIEKESKPESNQITWMDYKLIHFINQIDGNKLKEEVTIKDWLGRFNDTLNPLAYDSLKEIVELGTINNNPIEMQIPQLIFFTDLSVQESQPLKIFTFMKFIQQIIWKFLNRVSSDFQDSSNSDIPLKIISGYPVTDVDSFGFVICDTIIIQVLELLNILPFIPKLLIKDKPLIKNLDLSVNGIKLINQNLNFFIYTTPHIMIAPREIFQNFNSKPIKSDWAKHFPFLNSYFFEPRNQDLKETIDHGLDLIFKINQQDNQAPQYKFCFFERFEIEIINVLKLFDINPQQACISFTQLMSQLFDHISSNGLQTKLVLDKQQNEASFVSKANQYTSMGIGCMNWNLAFFNKFLMTDITIQNISQGNFKDIQVSDAQFQSPSAKNGWVSGRIKKDKKEWRKVSKFYEDRDEYLFDLTVDEYKYFTQKDNEYFNSDSLIEKKKNQGQSDYKINSKDVKKLNQKIIYDWTLYQPTELLTIKQIIQEVKSLDYLWQGFQLAYCFIEIGIKKETNQELSPRQILTDPDLIKNNVWGFKIIYLTIGGVQCDQIHFINPQTITNYYSIGQLINQLKGWKGLYLWSKNQNVNSFLNQTNDNKIQNLADKLKKGMRYSEFEQEIFPESLSTKDASFLQLFISSLFGLKGQYCCLDIEQSNEKNQYQRLALTQGVIDDNVDVIPIPPNQELILFWLPYQYNESRQTSENFGFLPSKSVFLKVFQTQITINQIASEQYYTNKQTISLLALISKHLLPIVDDLRVRLKYVKKAKIDPLSIILRAVPRLFLPFSENANSIKNIQTNLSNFLKNKNLNEDLFKTQKLFEIYLTEMNDIISSAKPGLREYRGADFQIKIMKKHLTQISKFKDDNLTSIQIFYKFINHLQNQAQCNYWKLFKQSLSYQSDYSLGWVDQNFSFDINQSPCLVDQEKKNSCRFTVIGEDTFSQKYSRTISKLVPYQVKDTLKRTTTGSGRIQKVMDDLNKTQTKYTQWIKIGEQEFN